MTKTPRKAPENGRKVGGQPNNRNHLRHGLLAGKMPDGCKYVECRLNRFRRALEDAVIVLRGEVSLYDAAAIQTSLRWERHAALAQRWLRLESKKMKPAELLHFSREIARASTERDRAIATLRLDAPPKVPWIEGTAV